MAPILLASTLICVCAVFTSAKPYGNSGYGAYNNGGGGYDPNFALMLDGSDPNDGGSGQVGKIILPNPPKLPRIPMPMQAPNDGNRDRDPNQVPRMPNPMSAPSGNGPMDIDFPNYEPNDDESFFNNDDGFGDSYGGGNSNGYGGNGGKRYYNNNNNNNQNGWASHVQSAYGSRGASTTRAATAAPSSTSTAAPATSTMMAQTGQTTASGKY